MQKQTRKSLFRNSCQKWSHNFLKWRDAQAIKLRPMCFLLLPISTIFAWVAVAVGFANNSKKQVGNKSGHHRCTVFFNSVYGLHIGFDNFSTVKKSYSYIPSTQEIILTAYKKARYTLLTPSILVCVIFGVIIFVGLDTNLFIMAASAAAALICLGSTSYFDPFLNVVVEVKLFFLWFFINHLTILSWPAQKNFRLEIDDRHHQWH